MGGPPLGTPMDYVCNVWSMERNTGSSRVRYLIIRSHMQSARLSIFTSLDRMLNARRHRHCARAPDATVHAIFNALCVSPVLRDGSVYAYDYKAVERAHSFDYEYRTELDQLYSREIYIRNGAFLFFFFFPIIFFSFVPPTYVFHTNTHYKAMHKCLFRKKSTMYI